MTSLIRDKVAKDGCLEAETLTFSMNSRQIPADDVDRPGYSANRSDHNAEATAPAQRAPAAAAHFRPPAERAAAERERRRYLGCHRWAE
jgi:hypothetical protein